MQFHLSNQQRATECQNALFKKVPECVQVCLHTVYDCQGKIVVPPNDDSKNT